MNHIVDNAPIAETPPTNAERRDIQVERVCEEYEAMLETVHEEFTLRDEPFKPNSMAVYAEAMRRLREKYESACGE